MVRAVGMVVSLLCALGVAAAAPGKLGSEKRKAWLRLQRNDRILSKEEIEKAMAPHVPKISQCYQDHAFKQKGASGHLLLEMLIRPEGTVQTLLVRAKGVRGNELGACIRKLSETWEFPKRPGFTNTVMPFYFVKTDAKGAGPIESCWSASGCPSKKKERK